MLFFASPCCCQFVVAAVVAFSLVNSFVALTEIAVRGSLCPGSKGLDDKKKSGLGDEVSRRGSVEKTLLGFRILVQVFVCCCDALLLFMNSFVRFLFFFEGSGQRDVHTSSIPPPHFAGQLWRTCMSSCSAKDTLLLKYHHVCSYSANNFNSTQAPRAHSVYYTVTTHTTHTYVLL